MSSTAVGVTPCLPSSSSFSKRRASFRVIGSEKTRLFFKPLKSNRRFVVSCSMKIGAPVGPAGEQFSEKVRRLASEFESLMEPIDRVKRLLYYAAVLPPFDESARVPENRVTGCTTQVWLDARMDKNGKVRFRADSDSEITKGFCSCLIWMLDGADPEEVVRVTGEDLAGMNIGVHGKAQSRVNTWHNVLIGMQKRTMDLVAERGDGQSPFPSLVVSGAADIVCV
ncbi:hypothetical protein SLEP1_g32811 [Rubroshorea leprosula]|uniref:Fe-S metabolism associated domain-containing protein n=1 Tax=Rubroshorea leprosula TaxID=152421 RepID=A0AAV5KEK3_9ROSI|nr:hypothetical protein SLEP1_g32811 [Rubroshorea leprosula]